MRHRNAFLRLIPAVNLTVLALCGCVAPPKYSSTSYSRQETYFRPGNATHTYTVKAAEASGSPVKGATVEWKIKENGNDQTQTTTTDDNGESTITLSIEPELSRTIDWADYKSEARYSIKKDGYFSKSGYLSESSYRSANSKRDPRPQTATVRMVRPIDYFSEEFAQAKQHAQLRQKVLDFLTLIRLESLLNESDLKLHGIRLQEFKGKRYLIVELNSDNVFNSLKLDRYAVGKKVFDETVRKMLNPLNEKISDQKLFYGYNIIVNTKTKSFADEYASSDPLKFEFMMPQASVRNYKDKNISGQKLIDESIVLLNDERIDLKFQ